jgi:hypothetical protein
MADEQLLQRILSEIRVHLCQSPVLFQSVPPASSLPPKAHLGQFVPAVRFCQAVRTFSMCARVAWVNRCRRL